MINQNERPTLAPTTPTVAPRALCEQSVSDVILDQLGDELDRLQAADDVLDSRAYLARAYGRVKQYPGRAVV